MNQINYSIEGLLYAQMCERDMILPQKENAMKRTGVFSSLFGETK